MFGKKHLSCSFCGKKEDEVEKLVAGPRVYICDACVALASQIMKGDSGDDTPSPKAELSVWRRIAARLDRFWRSDGARRVGHARISATLSYPPAVFEK